MKPRALARFRAKLASATPTYGVWITLESASITEMAVGLGLDWVVIDAEHGHLDWKDILAHIRAAVRSDTLALVRIAELNGALIKRVLDIGADGIVIPWIETPDQLARAVRFARYPPNGSRGIGAERATAWGQRFAEHVAEADESVLVIPLIESVEGGRNVPQMLSVPGVDVFYFGPADYSATAGYPGEWEGGDVGEAILEAKDRILAAGRHCGVVAPTNENLIQRREQGFRMLGLGMDTGMLLRSLRDALRTVDRDQPLNFELE
jgi:2-keto-3-deoxy-L-rhamnonate aldolase RhmA